MRILKTINLIQLQNHLGIKFKHHHAGEDATAAAKILIKTCEELNVNTVEELSSKLGLKIGRMYDGGYSSAGSLRTNTRRGSTRRLKNIDSEREKINHNNTTLICQERIICFLIKLWYSLVH